MGSSKESIYLETIGNTSEEIGHDFITELLNYLFVVKIHVTTKIKEIHHVCKKLFEDYTQPFCDKWSFLSNVQLSDDISRNYSFVITYSGIKNILPYDLLAFEAINPENTILDQLQCSNNLESFFVTLSKFISKLNLPLIKNDLKIIKFLINPIIRNECPYIPTNRQIAKSLDLSENTVSRRINYLYCNSMFYHIYRINMAKLGYYTSAIIHIDNLDILPLHFEPYCLVDVILDWGECISKLKIFQIPSTQKSVFCKIKDFFDPLYEITLTKNYIGWNLSGLSTKIEERWQKLPPIFICDTWIDHQFSEKFGVEQSLISNDNIIRITNKQARMLDLIQNGTSLSKIYLSKKLKVGQKYIKQFFDDFFLKRLINRFTILSNIGLQSKVWITLVGPRSRSNVNLLHNIIEHLKLVPFNYLFYNDNNLDLGGRLILTGFLWMPSSWFADFSTSWMKLKDEGFVPKILISQGLIKWGVELEKTYDFHSFF
ncbi:MAG: hypothetical protein ACFE9A_16490 [Candidatus Hodarchaeota archaeon]